MEVFLKCLARFSAIADLPVPHTPFMKISLLPASIASSISFTTSACVFPFENFRGSRDSPLSSKIESEFGVFLYRDHMRRGWEFLLIRFVVGLLLEPGFFGFSDYSFFQGVYSFV